MLEVGDGGPGTIVVEYLEVMESDIRDGRRGGLAGVIVLLNIAIPTRTGDANATLHANIQEETRNVYEKWR